MNKVGKFFRNLFFVLVALLVVLIIAFNIDTRKKKAAEVPAAELPTVEAAANKTADFPALRIPVATFMTRFLQSFSSISIYCGRSKTISSIFSCLL